MDLFIPNQNANMAMGGMMMPFESTYFVEDMSCLASTPLFHSEHSSSANSTPTSSVGLPFVAYDMACANPWLCDESASSSADMSDEPSSPSALSSAAMSPMSPQANDGDDEDSTVSSTREDFNPKKRSRDTFEVYAPALEAYPPAKHAKIAELDSLTPVSVSAIPTVARPVVPALSASIPLFISGPAPPVLTPMAGHDMHHLLSQQYSWNQLQIQQVMSCLNASQIHQAISIASAAPTNPCMMPVQAATGTAPAQQQQQQQQQVTAVMKPSVAKKNRSSGSSSSSSSSASSKKRPKLDPKKDALQCLGHNRKKNKQCGNAALMEFIGPRPLYCAEHIDQDPNSLYTKCASTHHKLSGDGKGCREVVLKELGLCHKHFDQVTSSWPLNPQGLATARSTLTRVSEILELLETEAAQAKKTDQDLFQRKHKIIPKFVQLVRHIEQWILDTRAAGVTSVLPSTNSSTAPSSLALSTEPLSFGAAL